MNRGRQEQPRSNDPQKGPLDGESAPGRVGDDADDHGGRGRAGAEWVAGKQCNQGEGTLVRRPVFGVGAEPFGESEGADPREGEVEGGADDRECEGDWAAVTSREGGKGGGGSELDQGGQAEEGAESGWETPSAASRVVGVAEGGRNRLRWSTLVGVAVPATGRKQDETCQDEQPDRVEVGAPRCFHDQKR